MVSEKNFSDYIKVNNKKDIIRIAEYTYCIPVKIDTEQFHLSNVQQHYDQPLHVSFYTKIK
jgi:hypothetical protein